MKLERVKLGDCAQIIRGITFSPKDTSSEKLNNTIGILRAGNIQEQLITNEDIIYIDNAKVGKQYPLIKDDIVMCTSSGSSKLVGKTAFVNESCNFTVGAFCCIIRTISASVLAKFLFYFLNSPIFKRWTELSPGINIKNIKLSELNDFQFYLPPISDQRRIAAILDKADAICRKRKESIKMLDELVKARFVEMFGDPVSNLKKINKIKLPQLCSIIDGDRGVNYPKQTDYMPEGYCLFLNAKNVTSDGFLFDDCTYISKDKDLSLRKGKLLYGDIVITTRGTIGNIAQYSQEIPFKNVRINSGMVIIRLNNFIMPQFFIEQFKLLLPFIKANIVNGVAQPQLPISLMDRISFIIPNTKEQSVFEKFVMKIHESKSSMQFQLQEAETMKAALMQQYFSQPIQDKICA